MKVWGYCSPASLKIDFNVPVATSWLLWLLVVNFLLVFGLNQTGWPCCCSPVG